MPAIAEGSAAPDFAMRNLENEVLRLSDLKGKRNAVVYFYPRDFTPGCTTEAAEFTRDYKKFQDAGIEIIGISPDTEDSHDKFREKMNIPYPLVSDPENEVAKSYGAYGKKTFMGREFLGVIRSTFLVDKSGNVIKVFGKVKPAGHSKEVLESFVG
jgi:peroxiredoxin Q/BCP